MILFYCVYIYIYLSIRYFFIHLLICSFISFFTSLHFFIDFLIFCSFKISLQARVLLMLQEKLPECTNKQRCDEFCTSFCYLNSKGARKKLVQALIKLPRSRLDLTTTYSRYSLLIFIDFFYVLIF